MPYLALRYYLSNTAARTDRWVQAVAVPLVLRRTSKPYFASLHFKDVDEDGHIAHRVLHLPSANEALAEAWLLGECARLESFRNPENVYSYELSGPETTEGVFLHYFEGLKRRHKAIAGASRATQGGLVQYMDIRKFYPSLDAGLAAQAWQRFADRAAMTRDLRELGLKLLEDQAAASTDSRSAVLTGPMFSHLLANLVLRDLDLRFARLSSVRYFRYVDDIVIVGQSSDVERAQTEIRSELEALGLKLHAPGTKKDIRVPAEEWLESEHDFDEKTGAVTWKSMIGDLKRYLLINPRKRLLAAQAFYDEGFRLPIVDYSEAIRERGYVTRLMETARWIWVRRSIRQKNLKEIIEQARVLRSRFMRDLSDLLEAFSRSRDFGRKRLIPKIRYYSGRIAYLGDRQLVAAFAEELQHIPELQFHRAVLSAVGTRDVGTVVSLGVNAAQAAAQLLRAGRMHASLSRAPTTDAEIQGIAVFLLNGVPVDGAGDGNWRENELVRVAQARIGDELMQSSDAFISEFACLHGIAATPRHPTVLETAFDVDEDLSLDAITQLQGYDSE